MFLSKSHCPKSFLVIEPILDAFSGYVPCPNGEGETHILVLPITFKYYTEIKQEFPNPDAVVCIGCDSHYGPNRRYLETTFPRPFVLYLEYPSEYIHNGPYKRMGKGEGEQMNYFNSYQVATDATKFTKRVMKVIHYS